MEFITKTRGSSERDVLLTFIDSYACWAMFSKGLDIIYDSKRSECDLPEYSQKLDYSIIPRHLADKIGEYHSFQLNWDGRNAPPIDECVISQTLKLIGFINKAVGPEKWSSISLDVCPTIAGGLQIDADHKNHSLELEINPEDHSFLKVIEGTEDEYEEGILSNLDDDIEELIDWLLSEE